MATNNFNASQFGELISKISTAENEMEQLFNVIGNDFSALSGIVSSEDSGLSNTCNTIQGTYKTLSVKLSNNLDQVKTELTNYMQQTIQNETSTSQNITNINESLDSIKGSLDSINI